MNTPAALVIALLRASDPMAVSKACCRLARHMRCSGVILRLFPDSLRPHFFAQPQDLPDRFHIIPTEGQVLVHPGSSDGHAVSILVASARQKLGWLTLVRINMFSSHEIIFIKSLVPHLKRALLRYQKAEQEALYRESIQMFTHRLSHPIIVVDWSLHILHCNPAGQSRALDIEFGENHQYKPLRRPRLPSEILSALIAIKEEAQSAHGPIDREFSSVKNPQLKYRITHICKKRRTFGLFLVSFSLPGRKEENVIASPDIERLSSAERTVFHHLQNGLSIKQIAALLCKSVDTIKNQTSAIHRKLGVQRRYDVIKFNISK